MCDEGKCLSMHQPWATLLVKGIKMWVSLRHVHVRVFTGLNQLLHVHSSEGDIFFRFVRRHSVPMAYSGWRTRFVVLFVLALLHQLLWALPTECQSTSCFDSWGRYGKALSCAWKLDRLCSVTACVSLNLQPICRFVPTLTVCLRPYFRVFMEICKTFVG